MGRMAVVDSGDCRVQSHQKNQTRPADARGNIEIDRGYPDLQTSVVSHKRVELFLFVLRERGSVQPG